MPQPIHIPELAVADRVQDALLVVDVQSRTPKTGDPFTVLKLGNQSGTIMTEPFWLDRQSEISGIRRGHVVQVIGEVALYRDRRQLKVTSVRALPKGSVPLDQLLPSVGAVDRYWESLDGWRREITKPRLAQVLALFYEDEQFRQDYGSCPGAVRGHHAALGGLLKHTTEVAAIGRTLARVSGADGDLVLAGALVHDIGKLDAYRWDGPFEHTEAGRLLGHVALGALRFDHRINQEPQPPCTPLERDLLLHLILSHHGQLEFGSPVVPMTLEAEALHRADNASAKLASVSDVLVDPECFPEGLVSLPQWTLDRRRVFKGQSDWGTGDAGRAR